MAEPPPTYTREEMDAILKRAIERQQAKAEEIGHEDLVAAAGEVGIPREEVEAAARDLEAEKARRAAGAAAPVARREAAALDQDRGPAVRKLLQRAMTYFALSMFFLFIGHETATGWWIWPVLAMGVSLVIRASRVFFGEPGGRAEQSLPRRERRRLRREERLADFERKVAIGADALVRVIEEAKGIKDRLEVEHAKHIARRRPVEQAVPPHPVRREPQEQGPRVLVTPPPVRVGVRPSEAESLEQDAGDERGEERRNRGA
jgi:hypothetical protein